MEEASRGLEKRCILGGSEEQTAVQILKEEVAIEEMVILTWLFVSD